MVEPALELGEMCDFKMFFRQIKSEVIPDYNFFIVCLISSHSGLSEIFHSTFNQQSYNFFILPLVSIHTEIKDFFLRNIFSECLVFQSKEQS